MILLCWTWCQLLIWFHRLKMQGISQIWPSSPIWFTILLEICLLNSCCLALIAFKWTPADLLQSLRSLCFLKCTRLYKGFRVNVLCSEKNTPSFIQLLSVDKCMDSKYCRFIHLEGVTLTAGILILPCQNPVVIRTEKGKNMVLWSSL